MMDCTEYRRALLADPGHPTSEMQTHVAACHDCTAYTERVMRFESRLDRALRVDTEKNVGPARAGETSASVLPHAASRTPGRAVRPRRWRRGLAVAASVMVAFVVAGGLWLSSTGSSLASDVVGHMAHEPGAWARTEVPVASPLLNSVMAESNVRLKSDAGLVSYASSCAFRGHQVPHLVVQTASGPVTVMVLTHESLRKSVHFDEHGYRGMIIPVPDHGSLAVLERGRTVDAKAMQGVAAHVLGAIEWTPPASP
jgi:Protein of unknown function (DUF3379)